MHCLASLQKPMHITFGVMGAINVSPRTPSCGKCGKESYERQRRDFVFARCPEQDLSPNEDILSYYYMMIVGWNPRTHNGQKAQRTMSMHCGYCTWFYSLCNTWELIRPNNAGTWTLFASLLLCGINVLCSGSHLSFPVPRSSSSAPKL